MAAKAWDDLTPDYRKRLIGAARSGKLTGSPVAPEQAAAVARAYRASGGDQSAARGHGKKTRPVYAAPARATQRSIAGQATDADDAALARWRASRRPPKWIPADQAMIANDTAAALSQLSIAPRYWRDVSITDQPDGTFLMTVIGSTGRKESIVLQDRDQVSEVGQLINEARRQQMAVNETERKRLEKEWTKTKRQRPMRVTITGTDQASKAAKLAAYQSESDALNRSKTPEQLFGGTSAPTRRKR